MRSTFLKIIERLMIKTKLVLVGVPAIIRNSKGDILLGKRGKSAPYYPSTWGLPGGLAERGETINQTALREIKEELGVDSKVLKQGKPFDSMPTKECPFQSLNIPIYCKLLGNPKPKSETSEVKWFKPLEIKRMKLAYSHKEILKREEII